MEQKKRKQTLTSSPSLDFTTKITVISDGPIQFLQSKIKQKCIGYTDFEYRYNSMTLNIVIYQRIDRF